MLLGNKTMMYSAPFFRIPMGLITKHLKNATEIYANMEYDPLL